MKITGARTVFSNSATTGHQLGAAVSAFGAGYSRSAFLTYLPAFVVAGGACLIAAGLVMTVKRNEPKPAVALP